MKLRILSLCLCFLLASLGQIWGVEVKDDPPTRKEKKDLKDWKKQIEKMQKQLEGQFQKYGGSLKKWENELRQEMGKFLAGEKSWAEFKAMMERLLKGKAIQRFSQRKKLEQSGKLIEAVLLQARSRAVATRTPHRLVFFVQPDGKKKSPRYGVAILRSPQGKTPGQYVGKAVFFPEGVVPHLYCTNSKHLVYLPRHEKSPAGKFKKDADPHLRGCLEFLPSGQLRFGGAFSDVPSFDPQGKLKDGAVIDGKAKADLTLQIKGSTLAGYLNLSKTGEKGQYRVVQFKGSRKE